MSARRKSRLQRKESLADMMDHFEEDPAGSSDIDGATSEEIAAELLAELKHLLAHAKAGAGAGVLLSPDDIIALTLKVDAMRFSEGFAERAAKTKERVARKMNTALSSVPEEFASDVRWGGENRYGSNVTFCTMVVCKVCVRVCVCVCVYVMFNGQRECALY